MLQENQLQPDMPSVLCAFHNLIVCRTWHMVPVSRNTAYLANWLLYSVA